MVNLKRTPEDILSSVLDLIHHQGFQATGLNEIFVASRVSSGSFYNYFRSKDELAHALIDFKWRQIKQNILEPAKQISDHPIEQLFWTFDQLEHRHLQEPDCGGCFLGNFIVDLAKHDSSFQAHLLEVFQEWQAEIAQFLQQGQIYLKPDVNPELLAEQLLITLEGVLLMGRLYSDSDYLKRGFNHVRGLIHSALIEGSDVSRRSQ